MALLHTIVSFLMHGERRRYKRIPCYIKARFFIGTNVHQHRGDAIITDVTLHGICCDQLHFFYEDTHLRLKRNLKINIYFTLADKSGTPHNFEIQGKIKSFIPKDTHGYAQRVGIEITSLRGRNKKIFGECVAVLKKSTAAPSQPRTQRRSQ